ncbi:MAG: DNA mismatch repair protein MutS [Gemmatimonadota bacterium]|nr:DNA mismatch repair protein MutS [Gemmatimonadota bacterium]
MTRAAAHTPLIQQYLDIKARHEDAILFFRVGDFYEMFFEDAEVGSRLLGITLTARNNGGSADVPLAGVPVKALGEYLPRLVREGRKVAICEQVEDAAEADGIVRREVVEIVTPGAVVDESLLEAGRNTFVAAVARGAAVAAGSGAAATGPAAVATADLSTGELEAWECGPQGVADELGRLEVSELLLPADAAEPGPGPWAVTRREPWRFEAEVGRDVLKRAFGVAGLEGFGLAVPRDAHLVAALGAVVGYLEEVRPGGLRHLRAPRVHRRGRHLHLDEMTRRNLEIVEPLRAGDGGTLVEVLDRTATPMGRRLLRRRLLRPLVEVAPIRERLDAVGELVGQRGARRGLREALGKVRDLERLAGRIALGRATPREVLGLGRSVEPLPEICEAAATLRSAPLRSLVDGLDPLADLREEIAAAIDPEAPPAVSAGGVIRAGHDARLDELRAVRDGAVDWIARLQAAERKNTGIENLKVGFNRVFGYYIEVTRSQLGRVPDRFERRQTLANAERFVTPELKEWEAKVVEAEAGIAEREAALFRELRERLAAEVGRVQEAAERVAELDVHCALADVAARGGYVRPEVVEESCLEIRAGRHPVVETRVPAGEFVPNDVVLEDESRIMILTGPNMAGKSTVLRQVGLIVLMAQAGSFVPAGRARIGICDRVFTRVGASDSLARGQSTFMVEMTETAAILNGATDRSLVLLDEIGRGTSTYDGVAIAWAVTEDLADRVGARTIFATHYHELVELADVKPGVGAWNVAVRETDDGIVFLRRLEPGGCDRSYGVHVARLAGVPAAVVARAGEILAELEGGEAGGTRLAGLADRSRDQLTLFDARESRLADRLEGIDPDRLTPLEALVLLHELKASAGSGDG